MNGDIYVTAVKVAKGKVELEYVDLKNGRPYSTEEKNQPHPDFMNSLKKLVPYLAKVYYLDDDSDKVSINGFSSGRDTTLVVLKGMLTVASGRKVAINSDAIDTEKEVYGFEPVLDDLIADIQGEAIKFFFEGKSSQATIPFEETDPDDNEPQETEYPNETEPSDSDLDDSKETPIEEETNADSLQEAIDEDEQETPVDEEPTGGVPGL